MRVEIFMRVFARSFPPLPSFYFSSGFFFSVVEPYLSLSLSRLVSLRFQGGSRDKFLVNLL